MSPAEKIPLPFRWQFFPLKSERGGDIRWAWRAFAQNGEMTMQSKEAFDTLTECIQDAKTKGYDKR